MMLPRRRETGRLMGRSRCPPPLTSPKRSHVWNWFCRYYLPVGLTLFLCLSQQCTKKISHHKNTNEDPVNNRLMFSVYGVWFWCSKCVHDWWSCQRQVVGLLGCWFFLFFFSKQTCCSRWQAVKDAPHPHSAILKADMVWGKFNHTLTPSSPLIIVMSAV